MTTPRTRIDEATNDFERDLLRSWEHDQPASKARERALAGVWGGAVLAPTRGAGAGALSRALEAG
jgi:hypothetical protein